MIKIEGKLTIKAMKGTRGAFCVGELVTDIGTFKVKDQVLDQYEEGAYEGTFVLSQIYLASYTYYGRYNVEMRAKVADMTLEMEEADKKPAKPSETPIDLDPAEESAAAAKSAILSSNDRNIKAASTNPAPVGDVSHAEDRDLFGEEVYELIERGEPVKLDPTVDRLVFRTQRDRLKAKGYKWEPTLQQWLTTAVQVMKEVTST